jgi:hypothetical protein
VRARTTWLLLAALAALAVAAYVAQGPARVDRPRERAPVFPGLRAADVQAVRIAKGATTVGLARAGAGWTVGAEKRAADAAAVERLLGDLAGLVSVAVASTNPAKRALFEVDDAAGASVRLEGAGGKLLAAFTVGKAGPDFASSYLRREGEERVLLVAAELHNALARREEGWRDWRLVPFGRDEITGVRVAAGGSTLVLNRSPKDGTWQVNGRAAGREAVDQFLDLVAGLRAADAAKPEEAAGLSTLSPDAVVTVEAGARRVDVSVLGRKTGTGFSYVRADGSAEVLLASQAALEKLLKKDADFPPPGATTAK